jgi:hypothetical protein
MAPADRRRLLGRPRHGAGHGRAGGSRSTEPRCAEDQRGRVQRSERRGLRRAHQQRSGCRHRRLHRQGQRRHACLHDPGRHDDRGRRLLRGEPRRGGRLRPRLGGLRPPVRPGRLPAARQLQLDRARRHHLRALPQRHRRVHDDGGLDAGCVEQLRRRRAGREDQRGRVQRSERRRLRRAHRQRRRDRHRRLGHQGQRRHPCLHDPGRHDDRGRRLLRGEPRRRGRLRPRLGGLRPPVRTRRDIARGQLQLDRARRHHLRALPQRHRRVHDDGGLDPGARRTSAPAT